VTRLEEALLILLLLALGALFLLAIYKLDGAMACVRHAGHSADVDFPQWCQEQVK